MDRTERASIEAACTRALGRAAAAHSVAPVGGGCINACYRAYTSGVGIFVKLNSTRFADAFAAEVDGLAALREAGMAAPEPLAHGTTGTHAFLALELLELGGAGDWPRLGSALANLHRASGQGFGWCRDNYIGATPQPNGWCRDWIEFWRDRRLAPQLALAEANGYGRDLRADIERLMAGLGALFSAYRPVSSLLHGDLWSGNAGFLANGAPVVFDPAVYRGDRESDIAMTELFGGFPAEFYAAYREAWPLDPGYTVRRDLYNLYHVLSHLNLFGAGYLGRARSLTRRLLSET